VKHFLIPARADVGAETETSGHFMHVIHRHSIDAASVQGSRVFLFRGKCLVGL